MSSRWTEPPACSPPAYASAEYARALAHLGRPLPLGATGGFVLARDIPLVGGAPPRLRDLTGPYPLFTCADWAALPDAVTGLGRDFVTLTLVLDPFCPVPQAVLAALFPLCRPLHAHHVIDLAAPPAPARHHRRKLRAAASAGPETPPLRLALRDLQADPPDAALLAGWQGLYDQLAARHGIRDLRRFGPGSFRHQLAVPGAHLVTAHAGDMLLGADLYYVDARDPRAGVARAHLSAYAAQGYARSVSYPMLAFAIRALADRARWLDLGGVPAGDQGGERGGGLAHFKRGWTRTTRPALLCGRVLDRPAHAALSAALRPTLPAAARDYFPPWRAGDFSRDGRLPRSSN